jgi:hypothetical protein
MLSMFILDRSHRALLEPDLLLRPAFSASLRNGWRRCSNSRRLPHSPISEHRRLGFVASFMRLACGFAERPVRQRRDRFLFGAPLQPAGVDGRFPQAGAQAVHRRH